MFSNNTDQKKALQWSFRLMGLDQSAVLQRNTYEGLKEVLSHHINGLIQKDFNKLVSLLYRIDVSEEKLTAALNNNRKGRNSGEVIAELIISRQLEKIETRKKYSRQDSNEG